MSRGRTKVYGKSEYVSGTRANWLLAAGHARLTPNAELEILITGGATPAGKVTAWTAGEARPVWAEHSPARLGGTLRGYAMNGGWINRG